MYSFLKFKNNKDRTAERVMIAGLLLFFCILAAVFYMLGHNTRHSLKARKAEEKTHRTMLLCADIQANVFAMESASRGFILTGDSVRLAQFTASSEEMKQNTLQLASSSSGELRQVLRVSRLTQLLEEKKKLYLRQIMAAGSTTAGMVKWPAKLDADQTSDQTIINLLDSLRGHAAQKLADRRLKYERSTEKSATLTNILAGLMLLTLFFGVVITLRALNVRKASENLARSGELYIRSILDNISDAVIATEENREVTVCNPAAEKLFGENARHMFTRGGSENFGLFDAETGQPACEQEHPVTKAASGEEINDREFFVKNPMLPQGRYISISARPVKKDRNIVPAVLVVRDITEKKRAHEQLIAANKELDAFCYSISHDLRAPLRSISGFAQILQEDYRDKLDKEATRICNVITRSAGRMGRLIDDLLKFSRLSKQSMSRTPVNMSALIRSVAEKILMEEKRNVSLKVHDMPRAFADPDMIKQAVVNIIANAVKYSSRQPAPEIEAGSLEKNAETVYYVRDNGVGFNMEYYDKLFQVFQRLHSDREFEGTGVGLSLAHRIISRHGGSIWAESSPGEGATFYFTIPTPETNGKL